MMTLINSSPLFFCASSWVCGMFFLLHLKISSLLSQKSPSCHLEPCLSWVRLIAHTLKHNKWMTFREGRTHCIKVFSYVNHCFPMWPIYQSSLSVLGSMAMELSDANLQTLTEYLKKTLDPDPAIRRPGKENIVLWFDLFFNGWWKPLHNLSVFIKWKKDLTLDSWA